MMTSFIVMAGIAAVGWVCAGVFLILLNQERQENDSLHGACDIWREIANRYWEEKLEVQRKLEESYGGCGDL